MSITPSLHKVFAHSWELIEKNDSHGLGISDESGMERCNKILRRIRTQESRKISQFSNLQDTLNRMWMSSDPKINKERVKAMPYCTFCKESGHSIRYCSKIRKIVTVQAEEETLLNSFIE